MSDEICNVGHNESAVPAPADAPRWTATQREAIERAQDAVEMLKAGVSDPAVYAALIASSEAVADLLAAAPSGGARLESAWHDISTAPKDGSYMMLWCADEETAPWAYRCGRWDIGAEPPYWEYPNESLAYCLAHPPTAWQPLPLPPTPTPQPKGKD